MNHSPSLALCTRSFSLCRNGKVIFLPRAQRLAQSRHGWCPALHFKYVANAKSLVEATLLLSSLILSHEVKPTTTLVARDYATAIAHGPSSLSL